MGNNRRRNGDSQAGTTFHLRLSSLVCAGTTRQVLVWLQSSTHEMKCKQDATSVPSTAQNGSIESQDSPLLLPSHVPHSLTSNNTYLAVNSSNVSS